MINFSQVLSIYFSLVMYLAKLHIRYDLASFLFSFSFKDSCSIRLETTYVISFYLNYIIILLFRHALWLYDTLLFFFLKCSCISTFFQTFKTSIWEFTVSENLSRLSKTTLIYVFMKLSKSMKQLKFQISTLKLNRRYLSKI